MVHCLQVFIRLFSGTFKTIATTDTIKPTLTSSNGLCLTSGTCNTTLPINTSLTFTFSEPVYVASGSITLSSTSDNRSIPVTSSEIVGSGTNTITITPSTVLKPLTLYTVKIDSNNIIDASGNTYAGGSWRFNTADSPVKLTSVFPINGATNVNLSSNLELEFDKNVQAASNKKIQIRNVATNELVFNENATSSRVKIDGNKVTIDPSRDFNRNSTYYVTIESGAFFVSGNPAEVYYGLLNATDWRFQTGYGNDTTAPKLDTYSPSRNSTSVGSAEKLILTFSEPVYVRSGNIEIREYNSGAIYRSIDVTSSRVNGGGTNQLTIDPHVAQTGESSKSFTVGTRYYVTIDKQALVDVAGNAFEGITNKNYSFTVSSQQTGPQLTSLSPVNLSTTVATTNEKFKLTFDKPVQVNQHSSGATIYSVSSRSTDVTAVLTVDPKDSKVVNLTPASALDPNTDYYIHIEPNSIVDQSGNYFVGIKNQYQWKFKTLGGDTTPPSIIKTEVSGNTIRIVYNELLKETLNPSPASYYVTVAGNARNINSVKVEGNVVFLTLSSSVTNNQQVLVSYSKGRTGQIQDLTGNEAPDFANRVATNGFTEANPVVTSSSYSGSTITLTFSETLDTLNSLAYTQFVVTANGRAVTIQRLSQSNNSLVFTMNQSIASNSTVIVNYVQGLYPISGLSNNKVASFSHTVGTTNNSGGGEVAGPPTLQTISVVADKLFLKYNKTLNSSTKPGTYQYSVLVNGRTTSVRSVDLTTDTVVLTLSSTPAAADTVYVTYYGTGSTLHDNSNNAAASFSSVKATNGTTDGGSDKTTVSVQGAVIKGDTITINFSGALDAGSVPSETNFLVRISENVRVISNITINGSQVTLKLNSAAKVGETVKVSYFNTNSSLRSSAGIAVNGFTDLNVANQTTVLDALSNDYASHANGIIIKTSASTTSSDISPGGYTVNRYTIATEKLTTAISTLSDAKLTESQLIFEVPASERAAIVAYSISALEYAARKGDFTLVVKHGDKTYSLPVSSIDVNAAARALGGSSVSNYLKVVLEEGDTPATSSLVTAINRSGATLLEGPYYYDALIVNGSQTQPAKITGNLTRTVNTTRSITYNNTTAVFYDEVVGQISYVPTTFSKSGNTTTITFKRPGNSAYAIVSNNKLYSDSSKHWGLSSISLMTRKFIAEGHSATNFNPKTNITRGEFATYIVRGLGLSANKDAAKKFKDVNSNSVMGGYIGAAVEAGLVSGVSATSFEPNSYITRQDMALMMIRMANAVGLDTKLNATADSVLSGFKDKSSVSSYARTGLAQAIEIGIISGTSTTALSPKSNAERVQGIIMIQRVLERANYLQK